MATSIGYVTCCSTSAGESPEPRSSPTPIGGEVGTVGIERANDHRPARPEESFRATTTAPVTRDARSEVHERAHNHISMAGIAPFCSAALIDNAPRVTRGHLPARPA